jgi:flagellar hook assembly protein FlgD
VLRGPSPQPSRGAVELSYRLPQAGRVRVAIYDEGGRRIATLAEGEEPAGERRARWDARDAGSRRVPAGVYFAVVEFGGERRAAMVVLTP